MQESNLRYFNNVVLSEEEKGKLTSLLRENGTMMVLPYDQFIEHDNRHRDNDSGAENPDYIMKLAIEGGYNAVAVHYGVAKRFWSKYKGELPLILKINGKTSIPDDSEALSVHTSYVEDAVKLGASAIGYTMYYGSVMQTKDLPQLAKVRQECEKHGLPLIVWAYPRGSAIEAKGGKGTSYALESAARLAMEMGATIVKSNLPEAADAAFLSNELIPKYYRDLEVELQKLPEKEQKLARAKRVVEAAQGIPVLFSGGSRKGDEELFENARATVEAGGMGFIFGRNMWKRPKKEALVLTKKLQELLDENGKTIFNS